MLNALIPYAMRLRTRFPGLYAHLVGFARRFLGGRLGIYPRLMAGEVAAVTSVLRSSQWNMTAGKGLVHERLEASARATRSCTRSTPARRRRWR